jgi:hypothetical protein
MASLSDWDVLALDEKGRPSNGISDKSPGGVVIDVYANYLRILSAESWHPLCPHPSPQCGVIRSGDVEFLDVSVAAEQTGVNLIWACWFRVGTNVVGTVGTVVNGFDESGRYLGVTPEAAKNFAEQLRAWSRVGRIPHELSVLGVGNALRYNQGDAFFARQMGSAYAATAPGTAELPLFFHAGRNESIKPHLIHATATEPIPMPVAPQPPAAKKSRPRKARAASQAVSSKT